MLVFVANVSCVYPLEAIVIMSFASRHAMRTSVNNQTKPKVLLDQPIISFLHHCGLFLSWSLPYNESRNSQDILTKLLAFLKKWSICWFSETCGHILDMCGNKMYINYTASLHGFLVDYYVVLKMAQLNKNLNILFFNNSVKKSSLELTKNKNNMLF